MVSTDKLIVVNFNIHMDDDTQQQQFIHSFHHILYGVYLTANHGAGLLNEFVQSVGVTCSDAASPADHSVEECTGNIRLVDNIQHPKGSQEIKSDYSLLGSSKWGTGGTVCVGLHLHTGLLFYCHWWSNLQMGRKLVSFYPG